MVMSDDNDIATWTRDGAERRLYRQDVLVRTAELDDIESMVRVNTRSIEILGEDGLFMPMSADFFSGVVPAGFSVVLEKDNEVLGYSIAVPAGRSSPAFFAVTDDRCVGLLFGTALSPQLMRQGWQKWLIRLRLAAFQSTGYTEAQCTVSPFNVSSLINLVESGFQISALKLLLDGYPRFVVRHFLNGCDHEFPEATEKRRESLSRDRLSRHEHWLDEGYVGVASEREAELVVVYSRPEGSGT